MSQVPVSIADLGGTEIDLRFANSKEGRLFVIVAPVLRFADSKFLTDLVFKTLTSGQESWNEMQFSSSFSWWTWFTSLRYSFLIIVLLWCTDLGDDAKVEKIGPPEKVIAAFGPEVIGENVEGKVLSMGVVEHSGRTYYQFELEPPHVLITATAAGNRLYLFSVTASGIELLRPLMLHIKKQELLAINEVFVSQNEL